MTVGVDRLREDEEPTQKQALPAAPGSGLRGFVTLEALRGIAALAVAILHLANLRGIFGYDRSHFDLAHADSVAWFPIYLSVDFFLVLSGFVLSNAYTFPCGHEGMALRVKFLGYRIARLGPLYIFAAVVMWAVGMCTGTATSNDPGWTVPVELFVSVVFCISFVHRVPAVALLLVAALMQAAIASQYALLDLTTLHARTAPWAVARCACSFILGVAGQKIYVGLPSITDVAAPGGYVGLYATAAELALFAGTLYLTFVAYKARYSDFASPWLFAAVVVVFACSRGALSYVLALAPMFGTISYSIYLNQWAVIRLLGQLGFLGGGDVMQALTMFAVLLPYSFLTYHVVEKPSNIFLRGRVDRLMGSWFDGTAGATCLAAGDDSDDSTGLTDSPLETRSHGEP
mmetsp:Transcript_76830/g.222012  ORF Transcript_76830/g.222012 Transcript_76830/m.222012 type:complete len:402 (+) Transcript_76830:98-1303(+)